MTLAIGADHGGVRLKDAIKAYLDERGIAYHDFGTFTEESVDYPVIAAKVAHAVANGQYDRGLLFCGTGIGISIAANKASARPSAPTRTAPSIAAATTTPTSSAWAAG